MYKLSIKSGGYLTIIIFYESIKVDEVKDALTKININGMIISEVKGLAGKKATKRSTGERNTRLILYPRWK